MKVTTYLLIKNDFFNESCPILINLGPDSLNKIPVKNLALRWIRPNKSVTWPISASLIGQYSSVESKSTLEFFIGSVSGLVKAQPSFIYRWSSTRLLSASVVSQKSVFQLNGHSLHHVFFYFFKSLFTKVTNTRHEQLAKQC